MSTPSTATSVRTFTSGGTGTATASSGTVSGSTVQTATGTVQSGSDAEGGKVRQYESWSNKSEFILTLISYAVGFGNIWRFPYLLQKNGGAAFLIPYFLFLILAGIPLFFLELAIGQRMRRGGIGSWNAVSPYFAGVGLASGFLCLLVQIYYNTLLAWCFSYFTWSWSFPTLPWEKCDVTLKNESVIWYDEVPEKVNSHWNGSQTVISRERNASEEECELAGPARYFWYRVNLDVSEGIEDFGNWNGFMTLFILLSWVAVYLCIVKGLKVSGKIVYFTVIYPYFILVLFFIAGFFLAEWSEGFKILFAPRWERLADGKVWLDAGTQIFYTLGLGFGVLIIFSSYLPFNNDCYFDSFFIPIVNCATSLFASIVMFMILGSKGMVEYEECVKSRNETIYALIDVNSSIEHYHAHNFKIVSFNYPKDSFINALNISISNGTHTLVHPLYNNSENLIYAKYCDKEMIVRNTGVGTGMVFITFAQAVVQLPGSQFFSIIFFLMLITLGIGGSFGFVEGVICSILDLKIVQVKKWKITSVVCLLYTIVALILFSPGFGMYVLTFIDELCTGWPLMVVALMECIGVAWVYGLKQFSYDIKLMTGKRPTFYLLICWRFITPIVIVIVLIASIILQFLNGVKYPVWRKDLGVTEYVYWPALQVALGIIVSLLIISCIPILAICAKYGVKVIKEERAELPEEELKKERNYDEEKDRQGTSPLQRVMMAKSMEDLRAEMKKSITSLKKSASKTSRKELDDELDSDQPPSDATDTEDLGSSSSATASNAGSVSEDEKAPNPLD